MPAPNVNMELLIKMGGAYHFICAIFHLLFPRIYQWKNRLNGLPEKDQRQISGSLFLMNSCQLIFWLIAAYISLFFSHDLISTPLGVTVLTMIVLFWMIRIFVLQPVFVGFKTTMSKIQVVFFIVGLTLFIIPWIHVVLNR